MGGGILTVNIITRLTEKFRIMILLHFGLVTFKIHEWTIRKLCFLGLANVTVTPQTNYSVRWKHQDIFNKIKEKPTYF